MRKIEEIIIHIRTVVANPNINTTLVQTEDLELLCNQAELWIPQLIITAPKEEKEILLVSYQVQEDETVYISICNGCWSEKENHFVIGERGSILNNIVDACATHWLPKNRLVGFKI